jgi:cytochrome c oxidase subunit IV
MVPAGGQAISKYLAVYCSLIILVALQLIIGYRNIHGGALAVRLLTFGALETILVVGYFMNLSSEKRTFFKFVALFMLFVLATTNMIWTDSFRLLIYRLTNVGPS